MDLRYELWSNPVYVVCWSSLRALNGANAYVNRLGSVNSALAGNRIKESSNLKI